MKAMSIVCFAIAGLLGLGGLINASKPSISPLVTVVGSLVVPAIFAWWGVILWKRDVSQRSARDE